MVGLTLMAMSGGTQLNDAATAASSLPEMATSTTSMAIAPTTSATAATSATAITTPYGFSADHQGRRLVAATYRPLTYVCETVVFPGGGPPLPIETPTVDIQDLISSAGRPALISPTSSKSTAGRLMSMNLNGSRRSERPTGRTGRTSTRGHTEDSSSHCSNTDGSPCGRAGARPPPATWATR